jgi:hypothetical protein
MRDFPFEFCPSTSELLAYIRGVASADDARSLFPRVSAHLAECTDCREAVEQLRAADIETASQNAAMVADATQATESGGRLEDRANRSSTHPSAAPGPKRASRHLAREARSDARAILDALDDLLESQRRHLARMRASASREPLVGDVWTSHGSWGTAKSGISALFVVLRTFFEEWTAEPLIDLAPVTDDEWLAADWTLVLDVEHSGTGTPLALHLDLQCTTRRNVLRHWIGRLPDAAGVDLMTVLHAFERGEAPPADALRVGRLGQAAVRTRPEWTDFSRQLLSVCAVIRIPHEEEVKDECDRLDKQAREASACVESRECVDRGDRMSGARDEQPRPIIGRPSSAAGEREGPRPRTGSNAADVNSPSRLPPAERPPSVGSPAARADLSPTGSPTSPYTPPVARQSDPALSRPSCGAPNSSSVKGTIVIRLEGNVSARVFATLGDVFRWYLAQECEGDLRRWCLLRGRRIAWEMLKPYECLPAQVALRPDQLTVQMYRAPGAPSRIDVDTLLFVKEAAQRVRGVHELAGQQIGQRAARSKR